MGNLKNDLEKILQGKIDSRGYIEYGKILNDKNALTSLYTTYLQIETDWKLNDDAFAGLLKIASDKNKYKNYKVDWNIQNIEPFFEEFNVKRFWFRNSDKDSNPYRELSVKEDELLAFQDGINTIFYTGEYLDGGQMYTNLTEEKKSEVSDNIFLGEELNLFDNSSVKKGNPNDFIYAYFPKKLYQSQYSKKFYILTQGKSLLRNREQAIIRFYFNFKPNKVDTESSIQTYLKGIENFKSEVNSFVKTLESYLNNRNIPFQTKLPTSLENFDRSDNLVLYISQNHYYYVYEFIKIHIEKYKDILGKSNLPLFVERFDTSITGVGVAEDPINAKADSFGSHRCRLIYLTIKDLSKGVTPFGIKEIINSLKEQGYSESDFYRNPHTNYRYNTVKNIELNNTYSLRFNPLNTQYHLYIYGKAALNYALELMERAIWLDSENITWLTYDQGENTKKEFYRLISDEEQKVIFWFLSLIIQFGWMRKYFPNNLIFIIEQHASKTDSKLTPDVLKLKYGNAKKEYINIWNDAEVFINSQTWSILSLKQKVLSKGKEISDEVEEYWDTLFNSPQEDIFSKVYEIKKEQLGVSHETIKNARKVYYRYIRPLYPIPNKFKNYEFCPNENGKLQIAMLMLSIYNPNIFKEDS